MMCFILTIKRYFLTTPIKTLHGNTYFLNLKAALQTFMQKTQVFLLNVLKKTARPRKKY